jgi:hypothetical protein
VKLQLENTIEEEQGQVIGSITLKDIKVMLGGVIRSGKNEKTRTL